MDLITVISRAEQALGMLRIMKPMLGDNAPIIDKVADIVGRALSGAKLGAEGYSTLVNELNGVITDLEGIQARGGVTGDDFRAEIAAIDRRGTALDKIQARLAS